MVVLLGIASESLSQRINTPEEYTHSYDKLELTITDGMSRAYDLVGETIRGRRFPALWKSISRYVPSEDG
jgi:hypothetical protein